MPTLNLDFSSSVGFLFDSSKIQFQGGSAKLVSPYAQTRQTIQQATPQLANAWTNFSTSQANGADEVVHSPIIDGVRKYWNGTAWATATAGQANTAAEIAAHCASLFSSQINAEISLISYLKSADGSTTPTLTSATITYTAALDLDTYPSPDDVRAGVQFDNGQQIGTLPVPSDFVEDLDALFADFDSVQVAWTVSSTDYQALGKLDEPDITDGDSVISTEYVLTMKTTDASTIRRLQAITIDGVDYEVREHPRKIGDGKLVRMELTKES